LLSKLVVALESEKNFQLRQLYELNPSEFDLVIEILKEWRIDQPFTLNKKPITQLTRLVVPGAGDVRAVHVTVDTRQRNPFAVRLLEPAAAP
jgi:hypothetical protein